MGDVLNVVAISRHQPTYALGPQRGDDTRGAATPVKTRQRGLRDVQGIHEIQQILGQRRLLAGAHDLRIDKPRRAIAAQVGYQHAVATLGQHRRNVIVATWVVRETMQQNDRRTAFRAVGFIGHVEHGGAHVEQWGEWVHDGILVAGQR
ncbi:hypothetical protein AO063_13600 [Pseudomonas fluorescens ICMP 11288]|uniref:Uncharacterized protein n=1 Tax=Pseudomonas fluorescens ICMP 11288 TaxID=1198309 RepID=A0A0W0HRA8_PSEFL|nr:hypothetical protein AO063_13600 [Pseudomonas fluorescens ICMP 11288]